MLHCNGIDPFVTFMGSFNSGPISRIKDIVSSQVSTGYFSFCKFWVCASHRFNGKFTLNLTDAQVFKTKYFEIHPSSQYVTT